MAVAGARSVFYREAGAGPGPGVVCLHSNASSSGQWRSLIDLLSDRFRVLAPDTLGAGKSPPWPSGEDIALKDEVSLIAPVLDQAGERFAMVGHSYGAAIALMIALSNPDRVKAMALYEPTLFAVLAEESPGQEAFQEIDTVVNDSVACIEAGDLDAAARRFIDYWTGDGAWDSIPDDRKGPIAESMLNVEGWRRALSDEPTPLREFSKLDIPVLYMVGGRSPASSRGVARLLTERLPAVELRELTGLGHMAPVTHPDLVNPHIERFLMDHAE